MKNKRHLLALIGVIIIFSLVTSACALEHHGALRIVAPHNNDVLPENQPVRIRVEVVDMREVYQPALAWEQGQYNLVDDGSIVTEAGWQRLPGRGETLEFVINNPSAGPHYVMFQTQLRRLNRDYYDFPNDPDDRHYDHSDWYRTGEVCFWVGPNAPQDFCTIRTTTNPLTMASATPSPFPTFAPTPVPVLRNAEAQPSPIYYGDSCPDVSTITFRAVAVLPAGVTANQVTVQAHAQVLIGSTQTQRGDFVVNLVPAGAQDATTGGEIFTGTLALTHPYNDANNHFDPGSLGGGYGALLWYVDASRHDSSGLAVYLGRTANQVMDLAPCAQQNRRPHNNPGGGGGTGCEQYTNQTSCNLAGCSWNPQASTCSVNP